MDKVTPALEYQSLREELAASKKYVFERPLLILALGAAILSGGNELSAVFLPALMAGLLIFNLWFTVNRLRSAARIAAYIQWELEERRSEDWIGWESALREYRIWMKTKRQVREQMIADKLKREAVPDALMYYPAIYRLHLGLLILVLAAATAAFAYRSDTPTLIGLGATVLLSVLLVGYLIRWAPRDLASLIEKNRIIWKQVLKTNAEEDTI